MKQTHTLALALFLASALSLGASTNPNFWATNDQPLDAIATHKAVARISYPKEFKLFRLNTDLLRQQLFSIVDNRARSTVIVLPNADGQI